MAGHQSGHGQVVVQSGSRWPTLERPATQDDVAAALGDSVDQVNRKLNGVAPIQRTDAVRWRWLTGELERSPVPELAGRLADGTDVEAVLPDWALPSETDEQ